MMIGKIILAFAITAVIVAAMFYFGKMTDGK